VKDPQRFVEALSVNKVTRLVLGAIAFLRVILELVKTRCDNFLICDIASAVGGHCRLGWRRAFAAQFRRPS